MDIIAKYFLLGYAILILVLLLLYGVAVFGPMALSLASPVLGQ